MAKRRGTTHFIHDIFGNPARGLPSGRVTPETNGALATPNTVKEYIWLPETQIAPTYYLHASGMTGSRTVVDRPLAVVNAVNTATPVMWWVSVDHLHRPIKMTDAAKVAVWTAVWQPWGSPQSLTGTATLDARFPGQWYQARGCGWASEAQSKTAGLHYNWHRSYDPSLGRYTQPDPLGFVDGPSVYGYAIANPQRFVDRNGKQAIPLPGPLVFLPPLIAACHEMYKEYSRGGGGGGKDDDDDPCQGLFDADTAACKRVISKAARARCYDSADSRYGACRAGKPLPPLIRH